MLGQLNGFVEEVISGQKTTKAYHQEQTQIGRFDKKNKEAVDAYYNAEYYGAMTGPSVNFINNLSLAFISVFGSILFLLGRISIGDLSSFVLYSRRFSGPINEMANIVSELQSACAAAERVFDLMDQPTEPEDRPEAVELSQVDGDVKMDHVGFGYEKDKEIIHDLSLHAPPGGLTAIVGPTGGKDHAYKPPYALLRPGPGRDNPGRPGYPGYHQKEPAALIRNGAAGHLALYRHHLREPGLRQEGREALGRGGRGKGRQDTQVHNGPAKGL